MSRVYELYQRSENLYEENVKEIQETEGKIGNLKSDKSLVEKELAEARKQVEFLRNDLKEVREELNKETLKLKTLSKEQKVLSNTVSTLKPKPEKK